MFAQLIEEYYDKFFVSASLESVNEDVEIAEAVSKLERIEKIGFDLHPTNPSNRSTYRDLDRRLKDLEASRMRQEAESYARGFNREKLQKDDLYKGVIMAADGYGKAHISGVLDGQRVTISTEDSPVVAKVQVFDDPVAMLRQLMKTFRRIWDRVRDEID